ncbi:uncharacterized protein LOC144828294 [Lissotriton helveticus]
MKAVVFSILAAVLLFGTAHSLKCYVCPQTTGSCDTQSTCAAGSDKYCNSMILTSGSTTTVLKVCSAACTSSSSTLGSGTLTYSCCQTDLGNGATSGTTSRATTRTTIGATTRTTIGATSTRNSVETSMEISYTLHFLVAGISTILLKGGI